MGKNSKARRDAKIKLRRKEIYLDAVGGAMSGLSSTSPATFFGDPVSRMFRSSCSECGSAQLSWMSAADLAATVPPEQRERVTEGVAMVGADADAWLCAECGGFGLLGGGGAF